MCLQKEVKNIIVGLDFEEVEDVSSSLSCRFPFEGNRALNEDV